MEVLLDQTHAKRMYRCDFGAVHEHQLSAQTQILRLFCRQLREGICDFSAHLARRRLGKRHNEKGIYIAGIFGVRHAVEHALYQHSRLAGACGRRYQQRAASIVNCLSLLIGP